MASALSGGYPVAGCFARSVVNFAAGAFYYLPQAVLAATIIVAVVSLVDFATLKEAWHYDRADALSLIATALGVITMGAEVGILMGVALSLGVLTEMNTSLAKRGITLELAEVKGPVMDRLQHTALGQTLQGQVFQSVHAAFSRV